MTLRIGKPARGWLMNYRSRLLITAAILTAAAPAQEPAKKDAPAVSPAMKEALTAAKARNWKRAAEAWEKVTAQEPANAAAWANRGTAQLQNRDIKGAVASLEKAVALKGSLSEAWVALGTAYMEEKAPMRAVSCLTRAVHENPQDARTRNALAIMLKRVGWGGAAEAELQKALDLDPGYTEAHFNLAVLYLERRPPMLEMARRHYNAARELGAERDLMMEDQLAEKPETTDDSPVPPMPPDQPPLPPAKTTRPKS
jgi:Flp pilus assembly protein TadD